jgi:predicted GIY-YIG superfamily endonuclease
MEGQSEWRHTNSNKKRFMLDFYVYILLCADGSYYTGHTDNLEKRIAEHQQGQGAGYTAKRLPVRVVFSESFASRAEALEAEQKIKKWGKRKKAALSYKGWEGIINLRKK